MLHILNIFVFLIVAAGIFYGVVRLVNKVSANQQQHIYANIKQELQSNFDSEVEFFKTDESDGFLDFILEGLKIPLFSSARGTERFLIEGNLADNPFLAAVIRHPPHQSGGPRRYSYIYARSFAKTQIPPREDIPELGSETIQQALQLIYGKKEHQPVVIKHEQWLIAFKTELVPGLYRLQLNRFDNLKEKINPN
jgi:hypothetical protein